MASDKHDALYKIVLCGDSGVGKSSVMNRFADDVFLEDHNETVGIDFKMRKVEMDDLTVKLQIWDTAGQESYRSMIMTYLAQPGAVIIVYDITNKESFDNLFKWWQLLHGLGKDPAECLLIGNKNDMESERAVSSQEAEEYAERVGLAYVETSAKNTANVEKAFLTLTSALLKLRPPGSERVTVP